MICDLKVANSRAKINENFANYFLKPKLTTSAFLGKCSCKGILKNFFFFFFFKLLLKKTQRKFLYKKITGLTSGFSLYTFYLLRNI